MAKQEKKTIIYVKGTPTPERGTARSRWIDLFTSEERSIGWQSVGVIGLGVKTNFACQVVARSSLRKNNVIFANGVGIIDEDYRWELKAVLFNFKTFNVNIFKHQKVAQLLIDPDEEVEIKEVSQEEFDLWWAANPTGRGEGGIGSTWNTSVANVAGDNWEPSEKSDSDEEGRGEESWEESETKAAWWASDEKEQADDVVWNASEDKSEDENTWDWVWKEEDKGAAWENSKVTNTRASAVKARKK